MNNKKQYKLTIKKIIASFIAKHFSANLFLSLLITILILSDFFLSYLTIGFFPLRNYVVLLIIVLLIFLGGENLKLSRYLGAFLLLPLYGLLKDIIILNQYDIMFYAKQYILIAFLSILVIYNLTKTVGHNKIFIILLFIMLLNSMIAILQSFDLDVAWKLREVIFLDDSIISKQILGRERVVGLSYFSITLSNQLMLVMPIALYVYQSTNKKRYVYFFVIFFIALLLTKTRSAIIGVLIGMLIQVKISYKKFIIWGIPLSFILIGFQTLPIFDRFFTMDSSTLGRAYLFITAIHVAYNRFFFGLGSEYTNYNQYAVDYIPNLNLSQGANEALIYTPHNFFLNQFIIFGFFGFIYMIYLTIDLYRKIDKIKLTNTQLSNTFKAIFVATTINSLFHNGGYFNVTSFLFFIGIVLGVHHQHKNIINGYSNNVYI